MERLLKALDQDLSFDFPTISERIAFRSSGYQDAIDIQLFETVVSAVLSHHELRFVYRKTLERSGLTGRKFATMVGVKLSARTSSNNASRLSAEVRTRPDTSLFSSLLAILVGVIHRSAHPSFRIRRQKIRPSLS